MEKKKYRLPFILETIGETPRQSEINREEGLDAHQFIWVKKGAGRFVIDGKTHFLSENEGMFMRRNVAHSYCSEGGEFHTAWCTFNDGDYVVDYSIGNKTHVVFRVPEHIETEFKMLRDTAKSITTSYKVSAAGYSFVCDFFENITKNKDDVLGKAKEYMENNCHKPISLDEIADVTGLDRYALCRYFKKNSGKTVMEELLSIRINKAKRLLRYSSENIETVAMLCGFESSSYFSLKFRERCGCSPTEYRRKRL